MISQTSFLLNILRSTVKRRKTFKSQCFSDTSALAGTRVYKEELRKTQFHHQQHQYHVIASILIASVASVFAASSLSQRAYCDKVADDCRSDGDDDDMENYPIYTLEEVAQNDGRDGKPIWMTYGGVVYDVTNFVSNHPGGSEKLLMAAGSVSQLIGNLSLTNLLTNQRCSNFSDSISH